MGLDCTIFVLTRPPSISDGDDRGFVEATFRLEGESSLFSKMRGIVRHAPSRRWRTIQVPHGAWVTYADGSEVADRRNRELGWLHEDSVGNSLRSVKGLEFAAAAAKVPLNAAILHFVATHYSEHDVVLFWH